MKLHHDLGVTQKTAWHLAHHIHMMWQAGDFLLTGLIETDEIFLKLIDTLLKGGLTSGRFIMFGDFTNQDKERKNDF